MEPLLATGLRGDELSAATYKELKQQVAAAAAAAAGGNDKEIAASLWNSTTKQAAHKGGSIATADGNNHSCIPDHQFIYTIIRNYFDWYQWREV